MTGPSRRQRDEEFLATLIPPGGIHRTGGGIAAAGSQAADRASRTAWWSSSAPGPNGSEWPDAGQEQDWEPVSPPSGGGVQLVAYQPDASPSPVPGKRPVVGGKGGAASPKQVNSPQTAAQPGQGEVSRKPAPVTPAYPGAPPLGAMTLNEFLGPLKTGPAAPKLSFLDDFKAFTRQSKQVAAQPILADARDPRRTQSQRSVVPAKRANSGSPGQKGTPAQGSGGSHGPVQTGSNTPAGQTLLRVLRGLPPEEPESPYAAVGKAFREAAKLPSVRFGESYGPPDDLQNKTQKQAREQEAIRALRGERPAREGTYDTIGKAFVAERKLPWQQRRAIEKARSGQPLTLAEQRLVERGREQVAAEIGLPFTAHELRRRALFGPGSINPRTLKPAAPPSGDELLQDNFEHTLTPNERSATEQSYEIYRDKAARGELTPPPTFSESPQFRALQEQDLQRVRAWVAQNHFGISSIAAEKDLSNPAVQRELAAQLASKDPRTRYTDLAAQKHRYLAQLDFLASPDAAKRLGLKTQFGKQLLRAIVDERRTHLPTLKSEDEKGAGDVKVAAGAMALGFLAEALVAEGIASAPALLQMLGPSARAVPPAVGGLVEGGTQQAGTAYVGGERRPGELLKSFGIGGSLGALGGFLFGQLPAGELSTVERAQAVRTLEQASGKLEGVLRSAPAFSRESREALAELRTIRAKLAQVQDLGHVQIPRKQSRPGSPVEPTLGTRRGGVNASHSPLHDPVPSGPEAARFQAPVEPPAVTTAAKEPLPAGTGAAHARAGEPHGGAQGPHVVQQSPTPEPVRVHVDPEGRFHVEGHGPVDAEDAATLAALDDAHRRGGAEARSRVLEALPPERRSRVEGLAQELEQRGALGDVVQAQRDHVAARRGAGAETLPQGRVALTEPEPASSRGARETPGPTTGEDTGSVRVTEAEGPAGSDPGAVRPGAEDGARAPSGEAHPPERARAAAEAELDAATSAWHDRHGGKSYGPKPKPEVVEDALDVGRALVNAGARTKRELVQGLKQQLGPGHAEDFYQTVAGALERDTWSGGGRGGGSRPGVGGSGAENGGTAAPSLPAADGGSPPVPLGSRATSAGSRPGSHSGGEPNPAPGTPGAPAAVAEGNPAVTPTGSASGSVPAGTAGGSTSARAPGYGQGNRVFTPERADAARARLASVLPNLRGGRPVERFKQVRPELRELGSFHYEAGARQVETWKARLQAEIGADTLSSAQLNELWVKTKTSATKALNEAARDGTVPPPRSVLSGSVPSTAPEFSSGALLVSGPAEAVRQRTAARGAEAGGELLAKAASLPGALRTAPGSGGRGQVRWYEVGARPEFRPQREAMYAHLVAQRPELAGSRWAVPGYGKGTLRELLVERGVVPAELADRYALAGAKARPNGGRARQEAARATYGYAPSFPVFESASSGAALPTDETAVDWLRNKMWLYPPRVRIKRLEAPLVDIEEGQKWALKNIPGLRVADYGSIDERVVQKINHVTKSIADHFGVVVEGIAPFGRHGLRFRKSTVPMATEGLWIGFDQWNLVRDAYELYEKALGRRKHKSAADKSVEAIIAHEMGHILQKCGRTDLGEPLGWERSQDWVKSIVNKYRAQQGEELITAELSARAWYGGKGSLEEAWAETWALAFGAYWVDPATLRPETRQMVEQVLRALYPKQR